jgi:hypothetical protein
MMMRYFLTASQIFAQNQKSETLLKEIKNLFALHFGKMNIRTFAKSIIVMAYSIKEYMRCLVFGDVRVPKTSCRSFNGIHKRAYQLAKYRSSPNPPQGADVCAIHTTQ